MCRSSCWQRYEFHCLFSKLPVCFLRALYLAAFICGKAPICSLILCPRSLLPQFNNETFYEQMCELQRDSYATSATKRREALLRPLLVLPFFFVRVRCAARNGPFAEAAPSLKNTETVELQLSSHVHLRFSQRNSSQKKWRLLQEIQIPSNKRIRRMRVVTSVEGTFKSPKVRLGIRHVYFRPLGQAALDQANILSINTWYVAGKPKSSFFFCAPTHPLPYPHPLRLAKKPSPTCMFIVAHQPHFVVYRLGTIKKNDSQIIVPFMRNLPR